jgi:hypothetical protein
MGEVVVVGYVMLRSNVMHEGRGERGGEAGEGLVVEGRAVGRLRTGRLQLC